MKIIYNNIIPFKGFSAINLFGVLFVRKGVEINQAKINHERIHTEQMKELLYIGFYLLYVLMWLFNLIKFLNPYKAYLNIAFEKEAYRNSYDFDYINKRTKFAWLKI